jgi:collagenase-like PrtC family protease
VQAPASQSPEPSLSPTLELLAPAGDRACLVAALEAGADAVYLGLTALNARRYARNFSEPELEEACELAHGLGRRVHLTLNIDLAQSELGRAAEILEIASRLKIDAVLVRDPAFLSLKPHFPELEYHLSTQACVASAADVEAARDLGIRRVVLARELTLAEIAAASRVQGIETEVFVHGALCLAVSGRCLLSSWVGGRSGNRGQCTSPCRVPWTLDGRPGGTPLSPHDLSLAARVGELRAAGVRALKIEGRMKNPSWVRSAVKLLRKGIDGTATPEQIAAEAERRPAGTRRLTSAYLDGRRTEIVEVQDPLEIAEQVADAQAPAPPRFTVRPGVAALLDQIDSRASPQRWIEPDRVRLAQDQAADFLARVQPRSGAIVEGLEPDRLAQLVKSHPAAQIIVALPAVFFEVEREAVESLVAASRSLDLPVEVNSWGGWRLATAAGARMIAGPGLGVLNALAARELARLGFEEATVSVEADAAKLEALLCRSPLPCSVVVFGRPALVVTRAELPSAVVDAELEDRRAVRMKARRSSELWELRPVRPFDLRGMHLPASVSHAVADLVASPDPLAEWEGPVAGASGFNFDRTLT